MRRSLITAGLLLCLAALGAAQDAQEKAPATSSSPQLPAAQPDRPDVPSGTVVTKRDTDTVVQPRPKAIKVTPDVIKAAQKELQERGYYSGAATGSLGPQTRAAVRKFQADEKLKQTGQLDSDTLTKLNIGGTRMFGAAPSDLGRGGKAAGHNVKEGHPVEAGKAVGKGVGRFGKKVGKGTKSLAVEGVEKVGEGLGKVGGKLDGKEKDDKPAEPK